jgi:hypothetical protein
MEGAWVRWTTAGRSYEVVAARAAEVDGGAFPMRSIEALAEVGLLGLLSAVEVGGAGRGARAAARVVERLARECGSTAMVVCMHYAGVPVLEKFADLDVRRAVAAGRQVSTLAFSEAGSRSQFWTPVVGGTVVDGGGALSARRASSPRHPCRRGRLVRADRRRRDPPRCGSCPLCGQPAVARRSSTEPDCAAMILHR